MTTYREGNIKVGYNYDIIHDEMQISVSLPRLELAAMDRRDFANMMYDHMMIPLEEYNEQAKKVEQAKNDRILRDREIGVVPRGMNVVWCPECFMSISWMKEDMFSYGDEWHPFPGNEILAHTHD